MHLKEPLIDIIDKKNRLLFKSENPLYVLGNMSGCDFKNLFEFDNHYLNNVDIHPVIKSETGISVVTTVELIQSKYYTTVTVLLNEKMDNITLLNIYKLVSETISTTLWEDNAINDNKLDNALGNYYNLILIVCTGNHLEEYPFDISLFYSIRELLNKNIKESLNQLKFK